MIRVVVLLFLMAGVSGRAHHTTGRAQKHQVLEEHHREGGRKRLRLFFDINKTILFEDRAGLKTQDFVVDTILATNSWGIVSSTSTPTLSTCLTGPPEKPIFNQEGCGMRWLWDSSIPLQSVPQKDRVSYLQFAQEIATGLVQSGGMLSREDYEAVVLKAITTHHPGGSAPGDLSLEKATIMATLNSRREYSMVLESFQALCNILKGQDEYDWSLVMMTFGSDTPDLYRTILEFAGESPDTDLAELSGQWTRMGTEPHETVLHMLNNERMVAGEVGFTRIDSLLDGRSMDGCVNGDDYRSSPKLKTELKQLIAAGEPVCRENQYSGGARVIFTRNHHDPWRAHGKASLWGKVCLQGNPDVLSILMDDNLDTPGHKSKDPEGKPTVPDEAMIAVAWRKTGNDAWEELTWEQSRGKHLLRVDPLEALLDPGYFVHLINGAIEKYSSDRSEWPLLPRHKRHH